MIKVDNATEKQKRGFYAKSLNDPQALIVLMPELDRRTRNGMDNLWNKALKNFTTNSKSADTK